MCACACTHIHGYIEHLCSTLCLIILVHRATQVGLDMVNESTETNSGKPRSLIQPAYVLFFTCDLLNIVLCVFDVPQQHNEVTKINVKSIRVT